MRNNPFSLEGKIIIITGASSGIGRQCAISCSEMGAKCVLIARNAERLDETRSMMDNPDIHHVYTTDLRDHKEISKLSEFVKVNIGRINGIISCAGVSMVKPLKYCDSDFIVDILTTNVISAINLTREFCKLGSFAKEGGSIIYISSVMGIVGEIGKSIYSMSKGALISGAKSLACELARKKIRVNAVSPGVLITPINQNLPHIKDPEQRKITESKHLLGLGETSDVANACIYLLSDASKWVTGTNLIVDGGYTCV